MPSIKDPLYKLPIIEPLRKNRQFSSSANKPLLITGVNVESGEKRDYVVKLLKAERMSISAFMRELLAAFIAMEFDILVTSPAIINVSVEFVELLRNDEDFMVARQSLGSNFGTLYVDKFQTFLVNQPLQNTLRSKAIEIFAFDVFIQNADRSHEAPRKPNILTDGKELLVFDHEAAFGFIFELSFTRNKEPWIIRESDKHWIEKHCLFNYLKGYNLEKQTLLDKLVHLDDTFWDRAWELLPDPWKDKEQFDGIKTFLSQIVLNRETFVKNLQLLLA